VVVTSVTAIGTFRMRARLRGITVFMLAVATVKGFEQRARFKASAFDKISEERDALSRP
jgi:hypothetical protein